MPERKPEPNLARIYQKLQLIRRVEEEVARIYPTEKIKSPVHLSIRQEAVAVGVCDPLRADDVVSGTYRSHAAYIAKGGDIPAIFAELYGKGTGCARGKGGSMHIADMGHHILGTSAVVGTTVPIAVGYALALQREGAGRLAVAFFGDGATEEGVFHESLNFAALHKLPVLFVCENNGYAIHTPLSKRWATPRLCERVATYGISTHYVPDSDVLSIWKTANQAYDAIRSGTGPVFIECKTYRWKEHVGPGDDYQAGYRSRTDLGPWIANDQIAIIGAKLDPDLKTSLDAEIESEIAAAIDFAETSPFPEGDSIRMSTPSQATSGVLDVTGELCGCGCTRIQQSDFCGIGRPG
jgi:TPP-dependent pyruvate/acetoin dehydrogenase alpha subunit